MTKKQAVKLAAILRQAQEQQALKQQAKASLLIGMVVKTLESGEQSDA